MTTPRILAVLAIGGMLAVTPATAAQARQHPDVSSAGDEAYCGPGQEYSFYDWRTDSVQNTCTDRVQVPHEIVPPKPPIWKFWRWFR